MHPADEAPPRRFLLRPAGALTQVSSASALLLGTIALVLVQQGKTGGTALVIAWAIGAMAGLVFGGLMARGGLVSVLAGAAVVAGFGIVLLVMSYPQLRSILSLLPESDVEMIADVLVGLAVVMLCTAALCVASIPQALRYGRAVREAEHAAASGGIDAASSASFAQAMQVSSQTLHPDSPLMHVPSLRPASVGSFGGPVQAMPPAAPYGGGGPAMPPPYGANAVGPVMPAQPWAGPGMQVGPGGQFVPSYVDPATPQIPTAASTARGWTPSPARVTTTLVLRPKAEETRSRRRIYLALGGLAIGLGAGVGVMVSSANETRASDNVASASSGSDGTSVEPPAGSDARGSATTASGTAAVATGSATLDEGSGATPTTPVATPNVPVRTFLAEQRGAIAKADARGLADHVAPTAVAFGIDADDIAEGRVAIQAMFAKNLGDAPPDGFTVASKFVAIGEEKNHAWIAEELELSGPGVETRRIAITQLAAFLDGTWTTVAMHWGVPVPDDTAVRRAILGTLPTPRVVPVRADGGGDLDPAVRAAFASRTAFADARSERTDAFNFGSGPGERSTGGAAIKRLFGRLRSELRLVGGARVVAGAAWDPAQQAGSWIGFAALNADYTAKSRAATDVTQTFRVLAILIREGDAWKIVQTQFSNAGPL
ncbi:MAG: hypothetical protein JWP01_3204 [Myxococcales bacterium]|nr:hypothetical protein [Myxococcales bacterium]